MPDDPSARWAWMERHYGADPETPLEILDERWRLADGDHRERRAVARRSIEWLLRELDACIRVGESSAAVESNQRLADLFVFQVNEHLRRAVAMAERCEPVLSMETAAAVGVVVAKFASAFHSPRPVSMHVENLRVARDVLRAASAADGETFSALADLDDAMHGTAEPVEPEPAATTGSSVTTRALGSAEPEPTATAAPPVKRNKRPGGRTRIQDGPDDRRLYDAWKMDERADLKDLARRFKMTHKQVKAIIKRLRARDERAIAHKSRQDPS